MSQTILKNEALNILEELKLIEFLNQYGKTDIVGSVSLDLIVKLDIDLALVIREIDLFPTTNQIYKYLLNHPKVKEVRITDWRKEGGLKLAIDEYPFVSGNWSIDIWVTNQSQSTGLKLSKELNKKLNKTHRELILKIKKHYHHKNLLKDGLSLRIYGAVVDDNIQTLEKFQENYETKYD